MDNSFLFVQKLKSTVQMCDFSFTITALRFQFVLFQVEIVVFCFRSLAQTIASTIAVLFILSFIAINFFINKVQVR